MADEDEIDVLGDFSFNSCFAQNNQGIPSCSSREDTVHPQWLSDSTETNWYDKESKIIRDRSGPSRNVMGVKTTTFNIRNNNDVQTTWSPAERKMLMLEMAKYGRNIKKISQTIKSKTEAEIQGLIEAEHGILLEPSSYGLDKYEDHEDIPTVVQEEIVTHTNIKKVVINPINEIKRSYRKKAYSKLKTNIPKPKSFEIIKPELISTEEVFYDDDMIIGSTELIGSELEMTDIVSKNIAKYQAKVKAEKKVGNHRRKVSKSYDKSKPRNRSKELLKSPQGQQRKDSSQSDDSMKSPKMQIVLGSGQALPVSEGEEVIKIEKKKDSEPESDIEIDIGSDNEGSCRTGRSKQDETKLIEEPIAVPLRKFEPMPRRQKKINLDGGGGYTIMHTEAGDLLEVGSEPKREKQPRKQPIHLIRCRVYNAEKPAPYEVRLYVSTLILMDVHAHSSRAEVMGLTGGTGDTLGDSAVGDFAVGDSAVGAPRVLTVLAYRPAAAAAGSTHCDMDPVSQAGAAQALAARGLRVCGWHHSHPAFPCAPSALDLRSQRALQAALEWDLPLLGFITSQHWPPGRAASQYRCLRVEEDPTDPDIPVGYQFSVKLVPDLTVQSLPEYVQELSLVLRGTEKDEYSVDMLNDLCPQANITYLEKCISSVRHHLRSAGYSADHPLPPLLEQALRDVLK